MEQVESAAVATDEQVWQLPLAKDKYRKLLDSDVADMKNVGGPYGGAIVAALFLTSSSATSPWAHLDIAGPMNVDGDERWLHQGRHRLRHPAADRPRGQLPPGLRRNSSQRLGGGVVRGRRRR